MDVEGADKWLWHLSNGLLKFCLHRLVINVFYYTCAPVLSTMTSIL